MSDARPLSPLSFTIRRHVEDFIFGREERKGVMSNIKGRDTRRPVVFKMNVVVDSCYHIMRRSLEEHHSHHGAFEKFKVEAQIALNEFKENERRSAPSAVQSLALSCLEQVQDFLRSDLESELLRDHPDLRPRFMVLGEASASKKPPRHPTPRPGTEVRRNSHLRQLLRTASLCDEDKPLGLKEVSQPAGRKQVFLETYSSPMGLDPELFTEETSPGKEVIVRTLNTLREGFVTDLSDGACLRRIGYFKEACIDLSSGSQKLTLKLNFADV